MKPFNSLCIVTRDVPRLRQFYTAVLEEESQGDDVFAFWVSPRADLVIYDWEHTEQMAPGCMSNAGYGGCVLEFGVVDVDVEYERLKKLGVTFAKLPTTQSWGIRSVWFHDPDGNLINFNAPVAK
jgi:catechol 2,3-dioxygenase-like lactoylglutathione lyase family enzyme